MLVLPRRTVLRGLGVALGLPFLEAMLAPSAAARGSRGQGTHATPTRIVFVYVPNGVDQGAWTPAATGAEFDLPATLEPLAPFQHGLRVISGLAHDKARANGDGPGDHARASAAWLTGCQPVKSDGAVVRAGVSADQVLAAEIGARTPLRSLEIGVEGGGQSGQCDSGYSCAYSSNLSWSTPHTPCPKETDPRVVFDRLFGGDREETAEQRRERLATRRSLLDHVRADALALEARLGAQDRRKLDEYQCSIRELERRLELREVHGAVDAPERPKGEPSTYQEHLRLHADVLTLAFQTDATRIATFSFANEGSNRGYAFLEAPEGHHELSHHGNDAQKLEKVRRINRFHVEELAYFLARLRAAEEDGSNLFERTLVVYGSGIADGNRHNHDDLPILVCGRGNGLVTGKKHVRFPRETPAANLLLGLVASLGVERARHGDSTGAIDLGTA